MSLQQELCLLKPFRNSEHETILNIFVTGNLLVKEGHRILKPFGITEAHFNILMLLKFQSDNGRINQTVLGNMLLVNRSNVTGLIDRMEQAGLVRRVADTGDRRVHQIELTANGHDIFERARKAYFARIKEIMSEMTPDMRNQLIQMLENIRNSIRRI